MHLDSDLLQMEAFFISGCGRRGRKMSLPKFSSYIRASLENGQILPIINALVEECANHILSNGDMRSKSEYRAFCKKMCEIHPCLAFPGRHEWVSSCRLYFSLSSRKIELLFSYYRVIFQKGYLKRFEPFVCVRKN